MGWRWRSPFFGLGRALFKQDSQGVGDTVSTNALVVLLFYLWIGVYSSAEQKIRAQPATPEVVWGYLAQAFAVLKLVLITLFLLAELLDGGASYYIWRRGGPVERFPHMVLGR